MYNTSSCVLFSPMYYLSKYTGCCFLLSPLSCPLFLKVTDRALAKIPDLAENCWNWDHFSLGKVPSTPSLSLSSHHPYDKYKILIMAGISLYDWPLSTFSDSLFINSSTYILELPTQLQYQIVCLQPHFPFLQPGGLYLYNKPQQFYLSRLKCALTNTVLVAWPGPSALVHLRKYSSWFKIQLKGTSSLKTYKTPSNGADPRIAEPKG